MMMPGTRSPLALTAIRDMPLTRRGMLQRAAILGIGGVALAGPLGATVQAAQDEQTEWIIGLTEDVNVLDPNTGTSSGPADVPASNALYDGLVEAIALREGPG